MGFLEELNQRILFFDGGLGSLLQAQGLQPGELPELWNITHPEQIIALHRDYLGAGCDIINTNTFGVNRLKFPVDGEVSLEQVVRAAVSHARTAVEEAEGACARAAVPEAADSGRKKYIALDIGPTGKLLKPLGDLDFEDAYQLYSEVVKLGVEEGVDLILIETMSDSYELKAAVLAAKENSQLPVLVTVTFDEKGKLLTGGSVETVVSLLEGLGVDALGMNCGLGPVQMKHILSRLLEVTSLPVIVTPNAGLPRSEAGKTVYDIDADSFAREMEDIIRMGAGIVGGCCGTTPEHLKKTIDRCRHLPVKQPVKKERTVVSSYAQAVVIGEKPVIIGERINPTGKSRLKQALKDHNLEYLLREAVLQQEHGAHVLDVNVGLPEIDEPAMMEEVVKELQTVTDLPLQIDTSDMEVMERAMRIYNGKPLINSVNGKQESMEAVFPLVKHYGGVVVALTLDETGIPETAEGRLAIARKIYETAASYGIEKKDIIIDPLCLTVSSDSQGAITTLKAVSQVKQVLQGKTILGVSNVSFGLPQRETINSVFFAMALEHGLDAAIINPGSEAMRKSYDSFLALAGLDSQCQNYISRYGGQKQLEEKNGAVQNGAAQPASKADRAAGAGGEMTLSACIEKGLKDGAVKAVKERLKTEEPLCIIQEEMIPSLDLVGKGFEQGTVFLPQLLMSAEAAKGAFEVLKAHMETGGTRQESKGKIILATVKGDIHDIGKNIVKVLLENYSYEVLDLGKDVDPELIVETALKEQVPLVGLSALMTTTVPNMEAAITLLREKAPGVKVMVGGAVLTKDYAKVIGADQYCKDAMASVYYAQEVLG